MRKRKSLHVSSGMDDVVQFRYAVRVCLSMDLVYDYGLCNLLFSFCNWD